MMFFCKLLGFKTRMKSKKNSVVDSQAEIHFKEM